MSWLFLGEVPGLITLAGGVLCLAGVGVSRSTRSLRRRVPPVTPEPAVPAKSPRGSSMLILASDENLAGSAVNSHRWTRRLPIHSSGACSTGATALSPASRAAAWPRSTWPATSGSTGSSRSR
ncbi:hypothetical protein LUX32_45925 [Actinomadura madurae]|nr:hypothetical protein [Actinomadura madurae]